MEAVGLLNNKQIAKDVLVDPHNLNLLHALSEFALTLARYGIHVQVCSKRSLKRLPELPAEFKDNVRRSFILWNEWIQPEGSAVESGVSVNLEKQFLKKALKHFGFTVDDEFWNVLEKDDLVEIYGEDMVQLYRSMNFFEISGYSLLDLSVNEWFVLYERSRLVLEQINQKIAEVLKYSLPTQRFEIPRHILRERCEVGTAEPFVPRAVLVDFRHIASLKRHPLGKAQGFIVTCKAQIIAAGEESMKIGFV